MTQPTCEPIDPARLRKLPPHFAWVDHRLRDLMSQLTLSEIALLLFLHLAADRNGCCFWADRTLARKLGLSESLLVDARRGLLQKDFILYRYPLYQLLPLPASHPKNSSEVSP